MENYIFMLKKQMDEENAVIVIDNSDITKSCSLKIEAISDVRDGSIGKVKYPAAKHNASLMREA